MALLGWALTHYIHSLTSSINTSTSQFTLALHTIKSLRNSILSLYTDPFKRPTQQLRAPSTAARAPPAAARISAYSQLVTSHPGECQLPFACTGILDPGSRMHAPSETSLTIPRSRRRARVGGPSMNRSLDSGRFPQIPNRSFSSRWRT